MRVSEEENRASRYFFNESYSAFPYPIPKKIQNEVFVLAICKNILNSDHPAVQYAALLTPVLGQTLMAVHLAKDRFYLNDENRRGVNVLYALNFSLRAGQFLSIAKTCLSIQAIAAIALAILFPQPITFSYVVTAGLSLIALSIANNSPIARLDNLSWFIPSNQITEN